MINNDLLKKLNELDKFNSFTKKVEFANNNFNKIGAGSGRIVYQINDDKILKLAKNSKGIAQNETECNIGYNNYIQNIVTKIYDNANDYSWIVAEKVKKISEKRIKQLTGIPGLNDLYGYLINHVKNYNYHIDVNVEKTLNDNEFVSELLDLIYNYNVSYGDLGRVSSYGEVIRNGIPAVVVVDYGLNDIVYNNYYNPDRKRKHVLYELFDCGDGNDDILIDADNNHDIRKSMWALIPYDINVKEQKINENFINFVLKHNKFPNKPINRMPELADYFYDCIYGINNVLNIISNRKKFYDNLLALQDYLVKNLYYDKDLLLKEEIDLNNPFDFLNKNEAFEMASAVAEKLNLGGFSYLGGEGNGFAFKLNNGKVLKLTTDLCEVDAGIKIRQVYNVLKRIGAVYAVYKIIDTEKNKVVYALIEEFIQDQMPTYFHELYRIPEQIRSGLSHELMYLLLKNKTTKECPIQGDLNVYPQLAREILDGNPNAPVSKNDRENAYKFMMDLYEIKKELLALKIKSNDFNNFNNLGYKNGVLKYFDVGGCRESEPNFQKKDIIYLLENDDKSTNNINRDTFDNIAFQVAKKLNLNTPKYLGSGYWGIAYDIGNNLVLKLTTDRSEAAENLMLINKKLKNIAQPYKVLMITSENSKYPEIYAIVLEKLRTSSEIERLYKRINFVFKKLLNVDLSDVVEHYLGYWYNDEIDENKIDNYLKNNPQDNKFFQDLLKIAKEAKELGVESMDYLNSKNLGYKKNGELGFFDVGFGYYLTNPLNNLDKIDVYEDSTSLYSKLNSIGNDDFPKYNNNNTESPIDNDLDANSAIYNESKKSYMPNAKTVSIKKKCRLGGLGNTSIACNQGDINNLIFGSIIEGSIPYNRTFWGWVSPDNKFIEVPKFRHQEYIMRQYKNNDFNWDYDRIFNQALNDGWICVVFEYNSDKSIGSLSLNGGDMTRIKSVFKNMFLDLIKYGHVVYLDAENSHESKTFFTKTDDEKTKLVNFISENFNEVIDACEAYDDKKSLQTILNDKRNIALISLSNPKIKELVKKMGLNIIKIKQTYHPDSIEMSIVYRNGYDKQANRLRDIMKSHGGYVNDQSPREAYEIGKLLEYSDESILKYINRKYVKLPNGQYRFRTNIELQQYDNNYIKQIPFEEEEYKKYMNIDETLNNNTNMTKIMSLENLPFKDDIIKLGGNIYSVGGAVRDEFLDKESKDLDILISGIPMDKLEDILSKYGRVDAVDKLFGILKFKPNGSIEDIDIAILRTEKSTGVGGHKGFEVKSNHELSIEKDLERRDFTINAIAKDINGNIIDPYGGKKDLENKIIRIVNSEAFCDDPLRMLRAVQFASRFGFEIEPKTMKMIQNNSSRIKEIPAERILTEFDKIVKKGDIFGGALLLKQTGLLSQIFGRDADILMGKNVWNNIKTMGEFIYLLSHNLVDNPAEFYKNKLRGDINTYKEIKAIQLAFENGNINNITIACIIAHNMYVISPQSLQSKILPNIIKIAAHELLTGKFPKTISELAINGNDLLSLGLHDKQIGDSLKFMLINVYSGKVKNNKNDLLSLILK